jgi:hypothetical protein
MSPGDKYIYDLTGKHKWLRKRLHRYFNRFTEHEKILVLQKQLEFMTINQARKWGEEGEFQYACFILGIWAVYSEKQGDADDHEIEDRLGHRRLNSRKAFIKQHCMGRIQELYDQGVSWQSIADCLKREYEVSVSRVTVKRIFDEYGREKRP